jgi:hypothetical protein
MKKLALAVPLMALLLLGISTAAWAKIPSVKLTVSGGGLARTITITDPQMLAASNVWVGAFIDDSRPTIKQLPAGLRKYVVSFYVGSPDGNARKAYVVTYSPDLATHCGYVHLPGQGDPEQPRNWGSIMRPGRDGKWSYASPSWTSMLDAAIAHGGAHEAPH